MSEWDRNHNRTAMASSKAFDAYVKRIGHFSLHVDTRDGERWEYAIEPIRVKGDEYFTTREEAQIRAENRLFFILSATLKAMEKSK